MFHSICTIHPLIGSLFSHYKILRKVLPAVTHSHVSNLLHFNSFCSSIMLGHQPWSWSSACIICFNRPTGYISDILAACDFSQLPTCSFQSGCSKRSLHPTEVGLAGSFAHSAQIGIPLHSVLACSVQLKGGHVLAIRWAGSLVAMSAAFPNVVRVIMAFCFTFFHVRNTTVTVLLAEVAVANLVLVRRSAAMQQDSQPSKQYGKDLLAHCCCSYNTGTTLQKAARITGLNQKMQRAMRLNDLKPVQPHSGLKVTQTHHSP